MIAILVLIAGRQPRADVAATTKPVTAPANTLAALVSMPAALAKQRQIVRGASVSVTFKKASTQVAGKVVSQECDDIRCVLVIGLSGLPAPVLAADALEDAEVSLGGAGKAP
ncbi:hypothetical protein [Variovorax sp. J31P207]|uniref:hypothetical protein n=1 Tax=Variovorax sp. J31P207 TaxID=3053510 RepID=UPI002575752C|nr:hypothetical protein [Variovorax sp. J31P207]MDM0069658.1 hypothetical protein [Variovorax sp. J31P207]